jgi:hypothetical protein
MGGIPFIKEGNTPLSKEESDASSSEKNYIPSGLLDNVVHYTLCPLAKDKRAQLICHCHYIYLNMSWMGMVHTDHLVYMVGTNGIEPKG